MNVEVRHNGTNITDDVISYNREHYICSGVGIFTVTLVDTGRTFDPWDELILFEDGTRKGTYYIREIKDEINSIILDSQDGSLKLVDYFISELSSLNYVTTARYWIELYLNQAGVSYTFTTEDNGAPVNVDAPFGMSTAYETIVTLLQMSNWYMYFNSTGTCIIGSLTLSTGSPNAVLTDSTIRDIKIHKNDKMLRNRAVVWGGADLVYGSWVFADVSIQTTWNYDANDLRAVVLANQTIQTSYDATRLANQILSEFSRITVEKVITVVGEVNLELGDYAFVNSEFFTGGGMVTTISSVMSKSGFVTIITLDQRCPRLFAFIGNYDDYVYIGTSESGVWRKPLDGDLWSDYSTGLTELKITDLSINSGIFSATTSGGLLFYKTLYTNWFPFATDIAYFPSGVTPSGGMFTPSGISPSGVFATCTTIDKSDYTIYGGFTTASGVLPSGTFTGSGESWVVQITSYGSIIRSDKIILDIDGTLTENVTIVDIDNNGSENTLSVIAGGDLIPVVLDDDGDFGYTYLFGEIVANQPHNTGTLTRDVRGNILKQETTTTDRNTINTSLPPVNVIGDLTGKVSGTMGYAIGEGQNQTEDEGIWWGSAGSGTTLTISKKLWVNNGIDPPYMDYPVEFEYTIDPMPNSDGGNVRAIIEKTDGSFRILCSEFDTDTYYYRLYSYDPDTESTVLEASNSVTPTYTNYSNSKIKSGYIYVEEVYSSSTTSNCHNVTRDLVICNLDAETITIVNESFGDYDTERVYFINPLVINNYIISGYWYITNTVYSNDWAWGTISFVTDSIHVTQGGRTRTSDVMFQDSDCTVSGQECCQFSPMFNTNPFYKEGSLYTLGWNAQVNSTSMLAWCSFPIMKNYNNPDPICDGYDSYDDELHLHSIMVYFTPPSVPTLLWHKDMYDTNSGTFDTTVDGLQYNWEKGIDNTFIFTSHFCGSNQSTYYMLRGTHTSSDDPYDVHIYDLNEGVPVKVGEILYPSNYPISSSYRLHYISPQVDDIDGTIYGAWRHSSQSTTGYLIGHSSTGTLTKDFSSFGTILANRPGYIFGNNYIATSRSTSSDSFTNYKFYFYEQPTGETFQDYIVRQRQSEFEVIYSTNILHYVDNSKNAPTVAYPPFLSGEIYYPRFAVSYSNEPNSFIQGFTSVPVRDVRVFDVSDANYYVVESGVVSSGVFRYIGFVNSGGFFALDASLNNVDVLQIVTSSGVMASGIVPSGLTHLETSNISITTPYFFLASPSGFWQRNPGESYFIDYSATLPGSTITIIRLDDRL